MDTGELVSKHVTVAADVVETAVEHALQRGTCGVSVFYCADGTLIAAVDEAVPYGEIHHRRD